MISTNRDTYMTIWSIEEKDGRYRARTGTYRKNKKDNTYINSNWNVNFVGSAAEKAKTLVEKDKIVIKPGDLNIENIFLPEKAEGKPNSYLVVTVFDFEKQAPKTSDSPVQPANNDDDLPF